MSGDNPSFENLCLVSALGLERCAQYMAHLRALLHLGNIPEEAGLSDAVSTVMVGLEKELDLCSRWIGRLSSAGQTVAVSTDL